MDRRHGDNCRQHDKTKRKGNPRDCINVLILSMKAWVPSPFEIGCAKNNTLLTIVSRSLCYLRIYKSCGLHSSHAKVGKYEIFFLFVCVFVASLGIRAGINLLVKGLMCTLSHKVTEEIRCIRPMPDEFLMTTYHRWRGGGLTRGWQFLLTFTLS